jgi:hypothetical protein
MKAQKQVETYEPEHEPGGKLTVAYCRRILEQNGQPTEEAKVVAMRDFLYRMAAIECEQTQRLNKTG